MTTQARWTTVFASDWYLHRRKAYGPIADTVDPTLKKKVTVLRGAPSGCYLECGIPSSHEVAKFVFVTLLVEERPFAFYLYLRQTGPQPNLRLQFSNFPGAPKRLSNEIKLPVDIPANRWVTIEVDLPSIFATFNIKECSPKLAAFRLSAHMHVHGMFLGDRVPTTEERYSFLQYPRTYAPLYIAVGRLLAAPCQAKGSAAPPVVVVIRNKNEVLPRKDTEEAWPPPDVSEISASPSQGTYCCVENNYQPETPLPDRKPNVEECAPATAVPTPAVEPSTQSFMLSHLSSEPGRQEVATVWKLQKCIGYDGVRPGLLSWPKEDSMLFACGGTVVEQTISSGDQHHFTAPSPRPVTCFAAGERLLAVAYAADKSSSTPAAISLWDLETAKVVSTLYGQSGDFVSVSVGHRDQAVVALGGSNTHRQMAVVWDTSNVISTGSAPAIVRHLSDFLMHTVLFVPYELARIVGCGTSGLRFFRRKAGQCGLGVCSLQASPALQLPQLTYLSLALEASCTPIETGGMHRVLAGSREGFVLVVNYPTRTIVGLFQVHTPVTTLATLAGGVCVTGSSEGQIRVWRNDFSEFLLEARSDGCISAMITSPHETKIAIGTPTGIGILDLGQVEFVTLLRVHTGDVLSVRCNSSRPNFITCGADGLLIWDLPRCTVSQALDRLHPAFVLPALVSAGIVSCCSLANQGGTLPTNLAARPVALQILDGHPVGTCCADMEVSPAVLQPELSARPAFQPRVAVGSLLPCCADPHPVQAHMIALGFCSGTVRIVDLESETAAYQYWAHREPVRSVQHFRSGELLASLSADGAAISDCRSGYAVLKVIHFLRPYRNPFLATSADASEVIVVDSEAARLHFISGETLSVATEVDLSQGTNIVITAVASSLAPRQSQPAIFLGTESGLIWCTAPPFDHVACMASLCVPVCGYAQCLTASADGQWLAAGTSRGGVLVWHLPSHRQVCNELIHPAPILALSFQGGTLLAAASGGALYSWHNGNQQN
eukprot:TRINITY_DN7650_c0_g1_i1.p1 TRINITY_DN7650_c0_g1~~TRINITY_DN7650_c0_g1_i1.p1  ORF type:complete len:1002 (+),score=89.00 TRINITY_DN7650_c0_g1_i1:34-3039(+)